LNSISATARGNMPATRSSQRGEYISLSGKDKAASKRPAPTPEKTDTKRRRQSQGSSSPQKEKPAAETTQPRQEELSLKDLEHPARVVVPKASTHDPFVRETTYLGAAQQRFRGDVVPIARKPTPVAAAPKVPVTASTSKPSDKPSVEQKVPSSKSSVAPTQRPAVQPPQNPPTQNAQQKPVVRRRQGTRLNLFNFVSILVLAYFAYTTETKTQANKHQLQVLLNEVKQKPDFERNDNKFQTQIQGLEEEMKQQFALFATELATALNSSSMSVEKAEEAASKCVQESLRFAAIESSLRGKEGSTESAADITKIMDKLKGQLEEQLANKEKSLSATLEKKRFLSTEKLEKQLEERASSLQEQIIANSVSFVEKELKKKLEKPGGSGKEDPVRTVTKMAGNPSIAAAVSKSANVVETTRIAVFLGIVLIIAIEVVKSPFSETDSSIRFFLNIVPYIVIAFLLTLIISGETRARKVLTLQEPNLLLLPSGVSAENCYPLQTYNLDIKLHDPSPLSAIEFKSTTSSTLTLSKLQCFSDITGEVV